MSLLSNPHLFESSRWQGLRVGLLGGSFSPPHEGHLHISLAAMKGLKLDAVWWLVTPKNPLKNELSLPFEERMKLSRSFIDHPKILITSLEKDLGTYLTYNSICKLKKYFSKTEFVWISGMDNVHTFHKWYNWRKLLEEICMVHLTRSPARFLVQNCPLRMYGKQKHIFINRAGYVPLEPCTSYWMLQKKMLDISSTQIRNKIDENQCVQAQHRLYLPDRSKQNIMSV